MKKNKNIIFHACIAFIFASMLLANREIYPQITSESQAIEELRIALQITYLPISLATTVINQEFGNGLYKAWPHIFEIMVKTKGLVAIIKDLIPLINRTLVDVRANLNKLKAEDSKEKSTGQPGINTVYAVGYGIAAIENLLPLLKELSKENGPLANISDWLDIVATGFVKSFEKTDNNGYGKNELELHKIATTLKTLSEKLRSEFIPQIESLLPVMKKNFETIFGQKI